MNEVEDRIESRKRNQMYKKVGRRYVPVTDPWARDGLGEGEWIVIVRSGSTTIRERLYMHTARAEVAAAVEQFRDVVVDAMSKANRLQPASEALTPKEKKAYKAYAKVLGDDAGSLAFRGISLWDVVEAGIKELQEKKGW